MQRCNTTNINDFITAVSSNFDTSHTFSLKKIVVKWISHSNMKLNQMYSHIDQTNSGKHTHEQTLRSWPTVNPVYKHWDQRQRSMQQAASIHHWFIYLIVPSRRMHLFGWFVGYIGPNTLQLPQQQPRPAPPVPNNTLPTLKEEEATLSSVVPQNCSSEKVFIALLLYQ